jgi:uncharacterized protein YggT (Ycf19 family)
MKEETLTDALLREFLLGKVNDEERGRIERLFLTDSQTRERVLALEQDLIEDYLESSLTEEDKERFLSRYAQTEDQRRTLRITKSIKDWAVAEARAPQVAAATVYGWSGLWARLRHRPVFVIPIVVTIVIAIVLAIVWLNSRTEQRKHFAIEQELAQLNSPASLREVPPQTISLDLRPVTVRGVESAAQLKIPSEIRRIELHLSSLQSERYSMYRAEVRRVGDRESFTIPNLQAESDGRYTIRLKLPVQMLKKGQYQINLTGIAADGSVSFSEEYMFAVGN